MDLTKTYPRAGDLILGGYPWLARMIDKAQAYNQGTLGDYIFPCPTDNELLSELNTTGTEFAELVARSANDADVLDALGLPADNPDTSVREWAQNFISNRHDSLKRQAEEEGRYYEA